MTKVSIQSSTMFFLQQILPHGAFWNTSLIAYSISENWILRCFICLLKIWVIPVHFLEVIKTQNFDSELLHKKTFPVQSINNFVRSSRNMLNYESKILHVFNPFFMFLVQLVLLSHELQSVIITVQNKLLRNQIMSPFLQCLYDHIEFLVIR
jgi:hypothetical protein